MIREKVVLQLKDALEGLRELGNLLMGVANKMGLLKQVTRNGQQSLVLDTELIAKSFALMAAVAGGSLKRMIDESPALGAEIAQLTFAFDSLFMSLGNALAPVLQPIVDWIKDAIKWFQGLDPVIQQTIAIFIAMTAAVSALAAVVLVLTTVSLPLIAAILAIAAAITAIIVIWNNWNRIMEWFSSKSTLVKVVILALLAIFTPFILAIVAIIAVVKNWGSIMEWFRNLFGKVTEYIVNAWDWAIDQIKSIWNTITGFFGGVGNIIGNLINSGFEVVKGVINTIGSWINEWIIAPLNTVLSALKDLDIGGWKPFTWISPLPEIPQFAQGAMNIPQDMLSVVHKGEMIIPRPFAEDLRNGRGIFGGVTVNISIESPMIRQVSDIDSLVQAIKEEVSREILERLERTTSWR